MAPGKSQKFVNVRREQVQYDDNGIPVRPPPEYNPLRPEASGRNVLNREEMLRIALLSLANLTESLTYS